LKKISVFWIVLIAVFFFMSLIVLSVIMAVIGDTDMGTGNVAVIPVKGVILSDQIDSVFGISAASSSEIIEMIQKADENPRIEAIVLEINSPGGSAVASDEIGQALTSTDKLKVAWIREVGASGGYWIASSCDHIVANRMSITGSIGVISSYLEFSGLLEEYNVTYQRLIAGKYKDIGTPYRPLSDDEKDILQTQLDQVHEFFIEEVAGNRELTLEQTRELATGLIFIGQQAKDNGLVDSLGSEPEVLSYIESELGIEAETVVYQKEKSLLEILSGVMYHGAFSAGRGFAFQMLIPESKKLELRI